MKAASLTRPAMEPRLWITGLLGPLGMFGPLARQVRTALAIALMAAIGAATATAQQADPDQPAPEQGLTLHATFADHMVVQREREWVLHGRGRPGSTLAIELVSGSPAARAAAMSLGVSPTGVWAATMPAVPADGRSYELRISDGRSRLVLEDIVFGEVWLASGQSNMRWNLQQVNDPALRSEGDDLLRFMVVLERESAEPLDTPIALQPWVTSTPDTLKGFSAVAYHFARELREALGVPVGVVLSAWGGTTAEAWTPAPVLAARPNLAQLSAGWNPDGSVNEAAPPRRRRPQDRPAGLYNAMIHPLRHTSFAGVIWYQGESNADRAKEYAELFPAMIEAWRDRLPKADHPLPFLFVQLANFKDRAAEPTDTDWARLREAQTAALRLPMTGMAVAIDVGEAKDIHPKNKLDVGRRLALQARRLVYAESDLDASGPEPVKIWFAPGPNGVQAAHIRFHAPSGLKTRDGGDIVGIAVADENGPFAWAQAVIEGDTVIAWSDRVATPAAVRYAWADNPDCNLVGGSGLPVGPFRSDAR